MRIAVFQPSQKLLLTLTAISIPLVVYATAKIVGGRAHEEEVRLADRAKALEKESESYRIQYEQVKTMVACVEKSNSELEARIASMKRRVSSIDVPPPPDKNKDDATIKSDLESAGLHFEFSTKNELTFPASRMIWEWRQEALACPRLRLSISGYQSIVEEQERLLGGKNDQIGLLEDGNKLLESSLDAQKRRAEALQGVIGSLETQKKASTFKWFVRLGAGIATGYLVGRATR